MDHTVLDEKNAKEGLSDLLDRVEEGEEIVIARSGRPVAKLVRLHHEPRRPGRLKGRIRTGPDLDAPLPETPLDEEARTGRRPHPSLAGKIKIHGEIFDSVPEEDWLPG